MEEKQTISTSKKILKEILSWVEILSFALIGAWLIQHFLIVNATIPSGSMENTIMTGDRVIANRLAYTFDNEVERGDVIVFQYPDDESILFVKRVIGLPGEIVYIDNGKVEVNGVVLFENYIKEETQGTWGPYEVPEGSYFCMGDNRNDSKDSRYWTNTYVSEDKILGKVVLRYWSKPCVFHDPEY